MIIKNQPDTALATELLEMEEVDQAMRAKFQAGEIDWDDSVDAKHTQRLKQIVAAHGWPTVSKVGEEAAGAAWLLAQHADHDPAFQQQCLVLMKQAEEGEVKPASIAYLEDRVRVHMGLPQLYGTQFCKEDGKPALSLLKTMGIWTKGVLQLGWGHSVSITKK